VQSKSAAAPSLMPEELPAVTVPPGLNAGLSRARSASVVFVGAQFGHREQFVGERAARDGGRRFALRVERERVLLFARDAVLLGDVLRGFAHRNRWIDFRELRIRHAPAERRIEHLRRAAEERVGLRHDVWCARHRLAPARDHDRAVAGGDRVRGRVHRL
jgi:hypothetical protein